MIYEITKGSGTISCSLTSEDHVQQELISLPVTPLVGLLRDYCKNLSLHLSTLQATSDQI
jgi:hypothetical protein